MFIQHYSQQNKLPLPESDPAEFTTSETAENTTRPKPTIFSIVAAESSLSKEKPT